MIHYLDEPVENALEWGFDRYGPWATGNTSCQIILSTQPIITQDNCPD